MGSWVPSVEDIFVGLSVVAYKKLWPTYPIAPQMILYDSVDVQKRNAKLTTGGLKMVALNSKETAIGGHPYKSICILIKALDEGALRAVCGAIAASNSSFELD
jgi:hypothetical protein